MKKKAQMAEAVLFFNERDICKEMLFPEFEAVLDGVVNLPEFAGEQVRAAYVLIDKRLMLRAAVLFYLDFDEDGAADSGWNIPLRNLAERGGPGPDLGGGPIRMVCRSQCPVSWHQMHLWNPERSGSDGEFNLMRERVRRNQLGLLVEEAPAATPSAPSKAPRGTASVPRAASADTPMGVPQYVVDDYRRQLQESQKLQAALSTRVAELEVQLRQSVERSEQLQGLLQTQAGRFRLVREDLAERLRQAERQHQAGLEAARLRTEQEAQARVTAIGEDYQRHLRGLQEQLAQRERQVLDLQRELDGLGQRCVELEGRTAERRLEELAAQGVVFVVYHPGAGQLTIPLHEMERYRADPLAYAAAHCDVTPQHYRQWLEHYMRPACQANLVNGDRCGLPVDRVPLPDQFVPGISDACARHRHERCLRTGS